MRIRSLVTCLLLLVIAMPVSAGIIGNWNGSGRSWNSSEFSTVRNTMIAAGNTVRPDEDLITAITGTNALVIGEATGAPNAGELLALDAWLRSGGILMLFGDSGGTGAAGNNAITTALGSTLHQANDFVNLPGTLVGGIFGSEGPPNNIVGLTLASTPASTISGGNELADGLIRWEALDSGYIFMFGDRLDHNVNVGGAGSVNFRLFENLAYGVANTPPTPPTNDIPEPSTTFLMLSGLALAALKLKRLI
jgi:hypothetical protein